MVHHHSRAPQHFILLLPLVDPCHVAAYGRLLSAKDCGGGALLHGHSPSLSQILLDLPVITWYASGMPTPLPSLPLDGAKAPDIP